MSGKIQVVAGDINNSPIRDDPRPSNGKEQTVDFRDADQVVTLLRQKGAALAKTAKDNPDSKYAAVADGVAILMFVTAQGMEVQAQRVRPATRVSPIIRG